MKISKILQNKKSFSIEVFPPKKDGNIEQLYQTIMDIKYLKPDFISVTYGAGGSTRKNTEKIASYIKSNIGIEPMANLTCIGSSIDELDKIISEFKENNIENILALRGDTPKEGDLKEGDFKHASDLVKYISKKDFCIGIACYPEKHPEARTLEDDINYHKLKFDNGASFGITQLFFDNKVFYNFIDKIEKIGINKPILAGIFIITNYNQLQKITEIAKPLLPETLKNNLEKYKDNQEVIKKIGIEFAINQSLDLLKNGVKGLHFYIMNQKESIIKIHEAIKNYL